MKKSIIILISILCLSFNDFKEKEEVFSGEYVTAKSGLLCREKPNGKVIHKFSYGTEVEIIDRTDIELTINDDGKTITGNWVEVRIENSNKTGYVFDGFLKPVMYLNSKLIAELTPPSFVKNSNSNGLILKGTHNLYDNKLNIIRQININKISEVTILSVTKFERPKIKVRKQTQENFWNEYCNWANFLKVIYKNEEVIVFGGNILQINRSEYKLFKGKNISFFFAENFLTKTGTLIHELSGCAYSNNIVIKYDQNYSLIHNNESKKEDVLTFDDNEYGSEHISSLIINKDTIFSKVEQSFQEGVGEYKLKIFNNNHDWKFIKYDEKRDFQQN